MQKSIKNKIAKYILWHPYNLNYIFSYEDKIFKLVFLKIIAIRSLIFQYLLRKNKINYRIRRFKQLVTTCENKQILVVANGKSSKKLNLSVISSRQKNGDLLIIGLNYSPILFNQSKLELDYLVISDHAMHPRNQSQVNVAFWDKVNMSKITRIITPENWCEKEYFQECKSGICLHFVDVGIEGIGKRISPLKPRSYLSITAMKALAIAIYLKPRKICIIGFDTDFYKNLHVDTNLKMYEGSYHALDVQHFKPDVTDFWPSGVSDYFFFVYRNFDSYRTFFSRYNILNLDVNSLVDCFKKVSEENDLESWELLI